MLQHEFLLGAPGDIWFASNFYDNVNLCKFVGKSQTHKSARLFILRFYIFVYVRFTCDVFRADIFHDEERKYNFVLCETHYARYTCRERKVSTSIHFRRHIFNDGE